jgi:hypothetical protein
MYLRFNTINKTTHKPNVLRFWIKIWCSTHLYCCSEPNMDDPLGFLLATQQKYKSRWFNERFYRLIVSKVFLTKVIKRRVRWVVATTVQVYGSFRLRGKIKNWKAHTWGRDCCGQGRIYTRYTSVAKKTCSQTL